MSNLIITSAIYGKVAFIPYPVAAGVTEVLEYLTDVSTSYTAKAEERSMMRALPRQSFECQYQASLGFMQEIYNAIYANIRGKWLIPCWFEAQDAASAVGKTVFNVDTVYNDIRANTHVLVFQSICKWQLMTVASITATTVTFTDGVLFAGPVVIIPCRIGWFSAQSDMAPNGYSNVFKGTFFVDDVLTGLTEVVPQYNGLDLYTTPYYRGDRGSAQVYWDEDQVEFDVGNIAHTTTWGNAQYQKQYVFDADGQQAYRGLKNYFYRRAGKWRPFYSPTFESNLQSRSTGNVGTTFKYKDEGYTDNLFAIRKTIAFGMNDGTWLIRTVSNAQHLGNNVDQFTLNTALGVKAEDIHVVSFLALNRLDTDRLEISLPSYKRFTASVNVREITP